MAGNEELELDLLNLDFRIMLFEERAKEINAQLDDLQKAIERAQQDLLTAGDDYWKADDA